MAVPTPYEKIVEELAGVPTDGKTTTAPEAKPATKQAPATVKEPGKSDKAVPALLRDEEPPDESAALAEIRKEFDEAAKSVDDPKRLEEHQKGFDKVFAKIKTEREELAKEKLSVEQLKNGMQEWLDFAAQFEDPQSFEQGLETLKQALYAKHGKTPTQAQVLAEVKKQTDGPGDTSAIEHEFCETHSWSEIKERWMGEFETRMEAKLESLSGQFKETVAPLVTSHALQARREQAAGKAEAALPGIQKDVGDWVTADMVAKAIVENPSMPVEKAFYATFGADIFKKGAEYGRGLSSGKQDMIGASALGTGAEVPGTNPDGSRKYVSYTDILKAQGIEEGTAHSMLNIF